MAWPEVWKCILGRTSYAGRMEHSRPCNGADSTARFAHTKASSKAKETFKPGSTRNSWQQLRIQLPSKLRIGPGSERFSTCFGELLRTNSLTDRCSRWDWL